MEEEYRVLLAAAEIGRADIINKAIEALTAGSPADQSPGGADKERRRLISVLRESDGASPLHISSMNGHIDASRALLRLGAAPEMQGTGHLSGKTPWDVATTAVRQVYANELFSQVAHGEEGKVLALLRAGVSANVTDGGPRSDTPLHWAAGGGHLNICSILLQNGADLNGCNNEGASALHEASKGGQAGVVSLLLERGANPHAVGTGGVFEDKSPLQVSSTEAVSEALRSPLPPLRSVLPPVGVAAPISDSQLSEESDDRRLPRTGDDTGGGEDEIFLAARSDGYTRYHVENGREGPGTEERKRESGQERATPPTASGAPRGVVGDGGGNPGRALPMLWPPPKSCTVIRDEVCRIPSQVVVVLPAGGVAGPGTLILRTLQAAFVSHGVMATCTRGRCPPGRGKDFFVTLACGGLQGACASSSSGGCGQGFSVVVGSGMVRVAGTGEPGLYYGVRTLCQLFKFYALPLSRESALDIPCCILRDEPDVVRRSLVMDVRYPLLPTSPSFMRTIKAASRSRINVIQLTVTRETASWLAEQDQRGQSQTIPASRGGDASRGMGERDRPNDMHNEEGAWGWGALGAIEAFCREHFMELVLGWTVVPGDESREAQRAAVQLLPPLSRQFQSNEVHIIFEEDVQLDWEGDHNREATPEPALDQPEEGAQPEGNIGVDRRPGLVRGLSSMSEPGDSRTAVPTTTETAGQREGLSLTRFLSNVVVACGQGTIVLDGLPSAAIASLQGVGYLPVEVACSLGADALSGYSLAPLFGDGVIDRRSDEFSMLLGPVHLGYVCAGHRGSGSGRREEACLSIRGALVDVARAVAVACRMGCGMQLRVSTTMASGTTVPSPGRPSTAAFAAGTTDSTCDGPNLYYPALLSDALEFFGAGLCWRLDKASVALHLPANEDGGGAVWGFEGDVSDPTAGERAGIGGTPVIGVLPLQGESDPSILMMAHVLQIDAWKMEAISAGQLASCLRMLLEKWNPFPVAEGNRGAGNDEEMAMQNLNTVLWAMHAPGGNYRLQFYLDDDTRFVLRALQRRYLQLEESSKLAYETVEATKTSLAIDARPLFLEIRRAVRLLKISGRLLQATSHHIRRPDHGLTRERRSDACPTSPSSTVPSPSSRPGLSHQQGRGGRAERNSPHASGNSVYPRGTFGTSNGSGGGDEGTLRNLRKSLAQLPSSTRLDFANRYLEEFRVLSASWDSTKHLSMGKMVLHASLSGLLRNLAHDESATQMEGLCKSAIYNC